MQHKPLLYLETSVFGFYFDEDPRNAVHREAVVTLMDQARLGILDIVTSPVTFRELRRSPERLRQKLLDLLSSVSTLRVDEQEVERLAEAYIRARSFLRTSRTTQGMLRTRPLAKPTYWYRSTCATLPTNGRKEESAL